MISKKKWCHLKEDRENKTKCMYNVLIIYISLRYVTLLSYHFESGRSYDDRQLTPIGPPRLPVIPPVPLITGPDRTQLNVQPCHYVF